MCVHTFVCIRVYMYVHVYMYACMYAYTYVCTYVHCMYVCTYVCICICMYVCAYVIVITQAQVIYLHGGYVRVHEPEGRSLWACAYVYISGKSLSHTILHYFTLISATFVTEFTKTSLDYTFCILR